MTLRVLYFAAVREAVGKSSEDISLPTGVTTMAALRDHIAARGDPWTALATMKNLRCAIGQQMKGFDAPVKDGDEVAFFPPVTGG